MLVAEISLANMASWGPYGLLVLMPTVLIVLLWWVSDSLFTLANAPSMAHKARSVGKGRPRSRGGGRVTKSLGMHPTRHVPLWIKGSREFPYVSDGEHTAMLPAGKDVDEVTVDEAAQLIEARLIESVQ